MFMVFKSKSMICLLLAGLLFSTLVMAQQRGGRVYRWLDNEGQVHYGRTLPPEYADLPYQKLNEAGIVVDSVAAALTDEQLAELATTELREAEAQKLQEIRDRQNRALIVKYPTIQAMEDSLAFNLERVGSDILIAQAMFDSQVKNLAKEVRNAADLQRAGRPVHEGLQTTIAEMRAGISNHQGKVDTLQVSREAVKNKYEQEKTRYLGIKRKR
jgi:hypothetical protein